MRTRPRESTSWAVCLMTGGSISGILSGMKLILCVLIASVQPAAAAEFASASKQASEMTAAFAKKMKAKVASAGGAAAETPRYSTRCEIKGDTGYGYVTNHARERLVLRGRINWYFYDDDGDEVDDDRDSISARISRGDTELLDEEDAPSGAKTCAIDVSEAVQGDEPEDDGDYSASCQLEDGRGVGYITVRNASSIRFSGRVTYYFYDARGRETDSERDRISIRVRRNDRERVGDVSAPSDAVSCSLDASEAAP